MRALYTNEKWFCDLLLENGGRKLAECNNMSGGKLYTIDVSNVDLGKIDSMVPNLEYSYKVFSVERPTMMF